MATRVWAASAAAINPTLLPLSSSPRPSRPAPSTRPPGHLRLRSRPPLPARVVCRRAKNAAFEDYKFPDPIPEFAEQVSDLLPPSPPASSSRDGASAPASFCCV